MASSINWNDLRYFLAIAQGGNSIGAAKLLGVNDTTIRRRVNALEQALSCRLFEPRDRGFVLTLDGERLLKAAEAIDGLVLTAQSDVGQKDLTLSGTVRVGAPDGLGSYFLAPRLAHLTEENPRLNIELVATSRQFKLSRRDADIAILMTRPTNGRQAVRKLTECVLHLRASVDYLRRHPPITQVGDLKNHRFIGSRKTSHSHLISTIFHPRDQPTAIDFQAPISSRNCRRRWRVPESVCCRASSRTALSDCNTFCRKSCISGGISGFPCTRISRI